MNKQEIFDKVYLGLKSQDFKPSMLGTSCAYRGKDGLKCAVGHLIPDELYDPTWEESGGTAVYNLPSNVKQFLGIFNQEDLEFIDGLQWVHDSCEFSEDDMQTRLKNFASEKGLTVPE